MRPKVEKRSLADHRLSLPPIHIPKVGNETSIEVRSPDMIKRLQDSARSENNFPILDRLNQTNGSSSTVQQLVETPPLY